MEAASSILGHIKIIVKNIVKKLIQYFWRIPSFEKQLQDYCSKMQLVILSENVFSGERKKERKEERKK